MEDSDNKVIEPEKRSRKDTFRERLGGKYPDLDMDDEEAFYGRISDDYEDYDSQIAERDSRIGQYQKANEEFGEMMARDPRTANLLLDLKDGKPLVSALVERFGDDLKQALDDPAKVDELAKAQEEYVQRVAKSKELDEAYAANMEKSLEAINAAVANGEISEAEVDAGIDALIKIVNDGITGNFTVDMLRWALKAENHDRDVANAAEDGEVRGRNAKIKETLRKADNVSRQPPVLGGQAKSQRSRGNGLGMLGKAAGAKSIWDD